MSTFFRFKVAAYLTGEGKYHVFLQVHVYGAFFVAYRFNVHGGFEYVPVEFPRLPAGAVV